MLHKSVTTSPSEPRGHLVRKLLLNPSNRHQVLKARSMYIMADLGGATDQDVLQDNHKVLLAVHAYPDGSFDMRPGVSTPGHKYRIEDAHGGVWEYSVENASPGGCKHVPLPS